MSQQWIEGNFTGTYVGERIGETDASRGARLFSFALQQGSAGSLAYVPEPDGDESAVRDRGEIYQARVDEISAVLPGRDSADPRVCELFDVRIRDFELSHPAEVNGRSYGTIHGTICGRLTPGVTETIAERALIPEPSETALDIVSPPLLELRSESPPARALDAEEVYARVGWISVFILFLLVALALHLNCGATTAGLWSIPVALALLLKRALRRFAIHTFDLGFWVGSGLVAYQIYWLMDPIALAWQHDCRANLHGSLLALEVPVVLSAALRSRWALVVSASIWTCTMFYGCNALGGTCTPSTVAIASAATSGRTDENGRWPAVPRDASSRADSEVSAGIGSSGSSASGKAGAADGPSASSGDGSGSAGVGVGGEGVGGLARGVGSGVGGSGENAVVRLGGDGSTRERGGSVEFGKPSAIALSGDSRFAEVDQASTRSFVRNSAPTGGARFGDSMDELLLISVEFANRNPAAFYESPIGRKVYMPSDPIFETRGAKIRQGADLTLTRLASLMNLRPGRRIALEIHTDASASAEVQKMLSRRRADALRAWLRASGRVDATQFEVLAAGSSRPLVPPHGGARAQEPNRRIEVRLLH